MNKVVQKLVDKLAILIVPIILKQLVKALEQLIKSDIDGDGKIGFDPTGREKGSVANA